MAEWRITPDYIETHWTDELLDLMITCLNKRKVKEHEAISRHSGGDERMVSDKQLFSQLGNNIKVTKKWQ